MQLVNNYEKYKNKNNSYKKQINKRKLLMSSVINKPDKSCTYRQILMSESQPADTSRFVILVGVWGEFGLIKKSELTAGDQETLFTPI